MSSSRSPDDILQAKIHSAISTRRRPVVGSGLAVSGNTLGSIGSGGPWQDASKQLGAASKHLDKLLRDADVVGVNGNDNTTVTYVSKVESYENARMTGVLEPTNLTAEQWDEIVVAADASNAAYETSQLSSLDTIIDETRSGSIKRTLISKTTRYGRSMVIVALRGSVTRADWVINLNHGVGNGGMAGGSIPDSVETELLPRIHPGLHAVAENMERRLRPRLLEALAAEPQTQTVLFTGHSAGGAVAQFLYGSTLGDSFGENITVDCITFGAPPIAKPPIPQRDNSLFISVINEGDPVPLIEPGYAYTLLKAYVAAKPPQHTHVPIPPRMFALSGTCIVLRDDRRLDAGQSDISAYEAENEHFSQVLFGNFVMHDRARYLSRVSAIAKKMAVC